MLVHADFSQRAVVTPDQHRWVPSPQAGVDRVMLDRLGGERARATSLVRYAPDSVFPVHRHPGGEEILVLLGTFSDGSGHYGPGCYLRNPPGSAHQPASAEGALIFVKLWQMAAEDTRVARVDTQDPATWRQEDTHAVCALHADAYEHVRLLKLPPCQPLQADTRDGAELLVLAGRLVERGLTYATHTWLRLPPGEATDIAAADEGVTLYLKTGHLAGTTP